MPKTIRMRCTTNAAPSDTANPSFNFRVDDIRDFTYDEARVLMQAQAAVPCHELPSDFTATMVKPSKASRTKATADDDKTGEDDKTASDADKS